MTAPIQPISFLPDDGYVAGACNIGPWEIRQRRLFAIASFVIAAIVFGLSVALAAPMVVRLIVLLPMWGGFFSWLQARRRFCAGYAVSRKRNFGDSHASLGTVDDEAAHRADMAAVARMARDSFLLAVIPSVVLALLPV